MKEKKTNWPVMVLLLLGLSTIAFPLYMTVIIAFKKPSEMTNSISGILSLPKSWSLDNFAEAIRVTDFWHSISYSLLITVITVVLSIALHSLMGYVIGRTGCRWMNRLQGWDMCLEGQKQKVNFIILSICLL